MDTCQHSKNRISLIWTLGSTYNEFSYNKPPRCRFLCTKITHSSPVLERLLTMKHPLATIKSFRICGSSTCKVWYTMYICNYGYKQSVLQRSFIFMTMSLCPVYTIPETISFTLFDILSFLLWWSSSWLPLSPCLVFLEYMFTVEIRKLFEISNPISTIWALFRGFEYPHSKCSLSIIRHLLKRNNSLRWILKKCNSHTSNDALIKGTLNIHYTGSSIIVKIIDLNIAGYLFLT